MVSVLSGPRVSISIIDCHMEETLSPASVLQILGQLSLSLLPLYIILSLTLMCVLGSMGASIDIIIALLSSLL